MSSHYVYLIRHNRQPVYVGLGQGYRTASSRWERAKALGVRPGELTVELVHEGLTRGEAMRAEVELIAQFGRQADGGPLLNKAPGGSAPSPQSIAKAVAKRRADRAARDEWLKHASPEEYEHLIVPYENSRLRFYRAPIGPKLSDADRPIPPAPMTREERSALTRARLSANRDAMRAAAAERAVEYDARRLAAALPLAA